MTAAFEGPTFTGVALRLEWVERAIAQITLTRPAQMNTLSLEFLSEFGHALDLLDFEGTRALIVTGQERAFCCGAHLSYFAGPDATFVEPFAARDRYLADIAVLFDRLEELHFPTNRRRQRLRWAAVASWPCRATSGCSPSTPGSACRKFRSASFRVAGEQRG